MHIVKYSERVHMARMHELASMNEFRIFYDIHSITFLLYTLLKIVILRLIVLLSTISKTIRPFILP